MLFLSSGGSVYGNTKDKPIKEDNLLQGTTNHYSSLKVCLETVILTFNKQQNSDFFILRITNPYGEGQNYTKGVGFIDAVIKQGLSNTPITIWGDGSTIRDYILHYIKIQCVSF